MTPHAVCHPLKNTSSCPTPELHAPQLNSRGNREDVFLSCRTATNPASCRESTINKDKLKTTDNHHSLACGLMTNTNDGHDMTKERCHHTAQVNKPTAFKHLLLRNTRKLIHHHVRMCHNHSSRSDSIDKHVSSDQSSSVMEVSSSEATEARLTHTDAQGRATMVDVGGKVPTRRTAVARATVKLGPTAFLLLRDNQLAKGDALTVAQIAGIMASKQTSSLIPLCHPLFLNHVSVSFELEEEHSAAVITATCSTTSQTGVEMEALTAVSVAALTIYDMCKAVSHDIVITDVKLVRKTGGKRDFNWQDSPPQLLLNHGKKARHLFCSGLCNYCITSSTLNPQKVLV